MNFYLVHKLIGYLMITELLFQRKDLLLDEFSEKENKIKYRQIKADLSFAWNPSVAGRGFFCVKNAAANPKVFRRTVWDSALYLI